MIDLEEIGREEAKEERSDDRQGQRLEAKLVVLPEHHAEKGAQENSGNSQLEEEGRFLDCLSFPPAEAKKISGAQEPDNEERQAPALRLGTNPADVRELPPPRKAKSEDQG